MVANLKLDSFSMLRGPLRRRYTGIASVEFVIALPLLMLLLVVTLESGRVLHQYMLLSNIAATAVRSGIQLAGLGEGCFESEDEGGNPSFFNLGYQETQPTGSGLAAHWFAQRRANVLLYHSRDQLLVGGTEYDAQPDMSSEFLRDTLDEESPSHSCESVTQVDEPKRGSFRNTFAVRLQGTYTPLLIPIPLPLSVESRASYLYENSNFPLQGGPPCRPQPAPTAPASATPDAGGPV